MVKMMAGMRGAVEAGKSWSVAGFGWARGLTARMLLLVLIAVMPGLAIQAYNEYDLRQSREQEIRDKTLQITKQFGAEMGELRA